MAYSTFDQFSNKALSLGHKSSTTFKLVVASVTKQHSKGSTQLSVTNNVPSLSLKLIGKLILEEALFAPTTFQAFKLIVALTLFTHFQWIVNLFLNPNREGAHADIAPLMHQMLRKCKPQH
jgi:hypothetical protein